MIEIRDSYTGAGAWSAIFLVWKVSGAACCLGMGIVVWIMSTKIWLNGGVKPVRTTKLTVYLYTLNTAARMWWDGLTFA